MNVRAGARLSGPWSPSSFRAEELGYWAHAPWHFHLEHQFLLEVPLGESSKGNHSDVVGVESSRWMGSSQ